ncbi:MAG: hypothetical protein LIP11_15535, partial [Clostridiales bacterium]|nr:hypothetical protein [Clostridiales bacterium]
WFSSVSFVRTNETGKSRLLQYLTKLSGSLLQPIFFNICQYWAEEVYAGKCAFDTMSWDFDDFEENGIEDVEEIEFVIRVYDYDDWSADDILNEIVTINP